MTVHAVSQTDLHQALASARSEAARILDQVNAVQRRLAATTYVGHNATVLATEMNDKMGVFVSVTYDNIDELLRLIVNNMNVVVTKLGGAPWAHQPVERGTASRAEAATGAADYVVDVEDLSRFADEVDVSFEEIVAGYHKLRSTVADGLPTWQGPEKQATVAAVTQAVDSIVGASGSDTGVRGVGSSLSDRLRSQIALMNA